MQFLKIKSPVNETIFIPTDKVLGITVYDQVLVVTEKESYYAEEFEIVNESQLISECQKAIDSYKLLPKYNSDELEF